MPGESDAPVHTKSGIQLYVQERPALTDTQYNTDGSEDQKNSSGRPDPGPSPPGLVGDPTAVAEHTISGPATFNTEPLETACFPLYDPGNTRGTIYALDQPFDLVFSLKIPSLDYKIFAYPEKLEVRIPVSFDPGASDYYQPMLRLPGTPAAPVLPNVEGLNPSGLFSYGARLVFGTLYPLTVPPSGNKVLSPLLMKVLMLVVMMTPRFARGKMQLNYFDSSSILRRDQVVLQETQDGSRLVQFDVWASSIYGHTTEPDTTPAIFQPKNVTIRRAATLSIIEPKFYDSSVQNIEIKVQFSTLLSEAQIVLMRIKGALDNEKTTLLPHGRAKTISYSVPVYQDILPKRIRVGVVSPGTLECMGPEIDLYGMPKLH